MCVGFNFEMTEWQVAEKEVKEVYKPPSPESHPREWPNASPSHLVEGSDQEGEAGEEEPSTSDTEIEPATPHPEHARKEELKKPSPKKSQPSAALGAGSPGARTPTKAKDEAGTFKA